MVITAVIIFVVSILIEDFVYCSTQNDGSTVQTTACFISRAGMDSEDVYHGRSIERFLLPIVLSSSYILLDVGINMWLSRRHRGALPVTYRRGDFIQLSQQPPVA